MSKKTKRDQYYLLTAEMCGAPVWWATDSSDAPALIGVNDAWSPSDVRARKFYRIREVKKLLNLRKDDKSIRRIKIIKIISKTEITIKPVKV